VKGGARPNSGPPPDPSALRRDRPSDKDGWRTLPAGCERPVPRWPLQSDVSNRARRAVAAETVDQLEADLDAASPRNRRKLQTAIGELREKLTVLDFLIAEQDRIERALWRELWKLPHANAWHELAWVRDVAQYVRHPTLGFLAPTGSRRTASCRTGPQGRPVRHVRLAAVVHRQPLPGQAPTAERPASWRRRSTTGGRRSSRRRRPARVRGRRRSSASRRRPGAVRRLGREARRLRLRRHGCGCGWEYEYEPGEPMGKPWPTPLIQLHATSEDQTDNVYRPLQAMVKHGPLGDMMQGRRGVHPAPRTTAGSTSSPRARWPGSATRSPSRCRTRPASTPSEQDGPRRRDPAPRASPAWVAGLMETTNAWDPSENSRRAAHRGVAPAGHLPVPPGAAGAPVLPQQAGAAPIHRFVYAGSAHVDLEAIEAEAAELLETGPGAGRAVLRQPDRVRARHLAPGRACGRRTAA
jgi:hypothetical protein